MAESKKEWYVLRAISGKEAKVKELLDAQIKNTNLGNYVSQVLIPSEKIVTTRNGKRVVKERNLYSGYVFIEATLTGEVIHELSNTTNVIDFLRGRSKGSAPESLRQSEVMRMLGAADEINDANEDGFNDFLVGEHVKVTVGPFAGFTGESVDLDSEKRKLKVEVKIFGRRTPLELEASQVERELAK